MHIWSARRLKHGKPIGAGVVRVDRVGLSKENNVKKLMTICFAVALLTCGVASAQDTMQNDNMKADASKKAVQVTGKISADGKTFVSDKDGKSWTIANPDAVKGHEGHHVILTAQVDADKNEVNVTSLKMAK
jgi:pentapeptide MXKDX repeat protein